MAHTNDFEDNPYVDPRRSRHEAQRRRAGAGQGGDNYGYRAAGYGQRGNRGSGIGYGSSGNRTGGYGVPGHGNESGQGARYGQGPSYGRGASARGYAASGMNSKEGFHARRREQPSPARPRATDSRRFSAARRDGGTHQSGFAVRDSVRGRAAGTTRRSGGYETPSHRGAAAQERPVRQMVTGPRGRTFQMPQLAGAMSRGGGLNVNVVTSIVGIVVVAVIAIVGILMWSNRSVDITLNGEDVSLRVGSTIEQVISNQQLAPTAGDLISVSGNKLKEGEGYPFLAKLNGNELDGAQTASYRVHAGDDLSIEDGRDRTEDYDVQTVTDAPKLEMGGDAWGNITYVSQWPKAGSYEMRTGKISGETARGNTIQETQNAVVSVHQIKPGDGRKLVALTFDDGPAEKYTEAYLDILNKYGIHATFFNLGSEIEKYPDLSKKIVDQGSEVMSHTYQHQQLSKLDASALQQEFSSAFAAIKDKVGVDTTGFRPPYGDFTEKAWLNSGGEASVSVLWNQDSLDWKRPGVNTIVTNALKNVTSGSIILMHDGGGNRDQDVQALPQIIETLQGQGYEFVTVSELMQSDDSIPDDIANGTATMPDDGEWPTELVATTTDAKTSTSTSATTGK